MKTILFVHHISSIGGASYCLLNILKEIPRDKYIPKVLLASDGPLAGELRKIGIEVIYLPTLIAWPYNMSLLRRSSIRSIVSLRKALRDFEEVLNANTDIDAVYLNNFMLAPYLKVAKTCEKKTIIHIREHWPLNEHRVQLSFMQKQIYKYADDVVAINRYSASMVPKRKSTIIYDWIDFSQRYKPMPFNEIFGEDCSDKKVFLFTGGKGVEKGCQEVISTFSSFQKEPDCRLLVTGLDIEKLLKVPKYDLRWLLNRISNRINDWELYNIIIHDRRIKCIPGIYEIKDIMQQAYCNLSFFTIPHANLALAENIILGTPSVAAETVESLEYSDNGKLAVLYKFGDIEAYIKAIEHLNNDYDNIKATIHKNRFKIEQMFSRDLNIKLLNTVYEKLV